MKTMKQTMKKGIAFLLVLVLVAGLCPISDLFGIGDEVEAAVVEEVIWSEGFEGESYQFKAMDNSVDIPASISSDAVRSGSKGLYLKNEGTQITIQANITNLESEATYELSFWVKNVSDTTDFLGKSLWIDHIF